MKWRILKFLNLNEYFRKNIQHLKHIGKFQLKHPDHFSDHAGYMETVTLVDYDVKKKELTVKRMNHREGEKAYIRKVHLSQIFLNS